MCCYLQLLSNHKEKHDKPGFPNEVLFHNQVVKENNRDTMQTQIWLHCVKCNALHSLELDWAINKHVRN